jgi:Domain of unknown function (DUF4398)
MATGHARTGLLSPTRVGMAMLAMLAVAALMSTSANGARAPTEQMAVARAAVADAVSAGGAEFAPGALIVAQEKLDRGAAAMTARQYDDARRLAEEAEVDARLAAVIARSAKTQRAVAEVESGIQALKDEIARNAR